MYEKRAARALSALRDDISDSGLQSLRGMFGGQSDYYASGPVQISVAQTRTAHEQAVSARAALDIDSWVESIATAGVVLRVRRGKATFDGQTRVHFDGLAEGVSRRYQLLGSPSGGSANAKRYWWNSDTGAYAVTGTTTKVYDPAAAISGAATSKVFMATYIPDRGVYEAIGGGGGSASAGTSPKLGKTDGSIANGATGTVSVFSGTLGAETDSGSNITALNKFIADTIPISKWVWCDNNGNGWYIVQAEC